MRVSLLHASSVDGEPRLGRAKSGVCSLPKRSALRESLNYPLSAQLRASSLERMMVGKSLQSHPAVAVRPHRNRRASGETHKVSNSPIACMRQTLLSTLGDVSHQRFAGQAEQQLPTNGTRILQICCSEIGVEVCIGCSLRCPLWEVPDALYSSYWRFI